MSREGSNYETPIAAMLTVDVQPSKLRSFLIVTMSLVATYGAVVGIVAATPGL